MSGSGIMTGLLAAGIAAALAGCQGTCDDCGYVETVQANYRTLASCVAGQPFEADEDAREGVSVGSNRARSVAAPSEIVEFDAAARRIVVDLGRYTEAGYRLSFVGLTDTTTEVRATPLGVSTIYFWPTQAAPLIARCSGRILR